MSLRLVASNVPAQPKNVMVDAAVTIAFLPYTTMFLAAELFFMMLGGQTRGARSIRGGERNWGGRVVVEGDFGRR